VFNFILDHGFNFYWLEKFHTRRILMEAFKASSVNTYYLSKNKSEAPASTFFDKCKQLDSKEKRVAHIK